MRALFLLTMMACSPMVYTHGVPNLVQVEGNIWRSGQIASTEGWDFIGTVAAGRHVHVIKLNYDTEGSDGGAVQQGFEVAYLPIQPEGDQDVFNDILGTVKQPDPANLDAAERELAWCLSHETTDMCLVHCTHGQDRTGLVVGIHRVEHDGWSKDLAFREMLKNHFHWALVGLMIAWEHVPGPREAAR